MRALGVAAVVGAVTLAGWALLGWYLAGSGDDDPTVSAAASVVVVLGVPYVLAATVLAHRAARVARGPDLPARAVALAAGDRRGGIDWGAAMRAELAAIDDPADRWRFAAGCVRATVAAAAGRTVYVVAAAAFAAFAVLTFAGSRVMLAGRPEGLLAWVYVVVIVVFVAGFVAAAQGESFRAGLVNGYVVLVAGLAAVVAVAAAEAVTWYHRAGVLIIDGDLPSGGIAGPGAAVADAVSGMTFFVLLFATPWPALGAAAGALCVRLGRVRTAAGDRY